MDQELGVRLHSDKPKIVMPTAYINQPGSRAHLVSERIEVIPPDSERGEKQKKKQIPVRDIDRVVVIEGAQLSGSAMGALMRADVPIALLGWNGKYLGGFQPCSSAHGAWRLRQYEKTRDLDFCLATAGRLIAAKIYNQRRVLQRMAANRNLKLDLEINELGGVLSRSYGATSLETLRGYEGAAAARYFQTWAKFLPKEFPFERRSTRPPLNPVNACISFGATLLYYETVSAIFARGLDPALGVLHATEDGRWSLALDLMEPYRSVLVEALTLDLFSHQILKTTHFEPKQGGTYLNSEGRARLIVQYERRMERQFMSEFAGHRTTLRRQLEQSVVSLKSSLENPAAFEAFIMN